MSQASGSRGLVLFLIVLAVFAIAVDLARPGSLLRSAWNRVSPSETRFERTVKDFQRTRGSTLPRSNHLDGGDSRSLMVEVRATA